MDDPKLGRVRVQMWHQLHFRQSPKHPMTLFRVERLEHPLRQPLWLAWVGLPTAKLLHPLRGGVHSDGVRTV